MDLRVPIFTFVAAGVLSCAHSSQEQATALREDELLRLRRENASLRQDIHHLEDRLLQLEHAESSATARAGTREGLPVVRLQPDQSPAAPEPRAPAPPPAPRRTAKGVSLAPLPNSASVEPDFPEAFRAAPEGSDWDAEPSGQNSTVPGDAPADRGDAVASRPSYRLEGTRLVNLTRAKAPAAPDGPALQGDPVVADYNQAMASYKAGDFQRAETLFARLAKSHPAHDYADNALYWRGEAAYDQRRYTDALAAFVEVVERYGGGNKAADALLKIGLCYQKTGDLDNAKDVLTELIAAYPRAKATTLARSKLAELEGDPP